MSLKSADIILGSSTIIVGLFFFLSFQSFADESAQENVQRFNELTDSQMEASTVSLLDYCHVDIPPLGTEGRFVYDENNVMYNVDDLDKIVDSPDYIPQFDNNAFSGFDVDADLQCFYENCDPINANCDWENQEDLCSQKMLECETVTCPVQKVDPLIPCREECSESYHSCIEENPDDWRVCEEQVFQCDNVCELENPSSPYISDMKVGSFGQLVSSGKQFSWDEKTIQAAQELQDHPTKCAELRFSYLESPPLPFHSVIGTGLDSSVEINKSNKLLSNTALSMSFVITIFSFAAVSEAIVSYRKTDEKTKASVIGFISFIVGFVGLAFSIIWFAIQRVDLINLRI